MDPFSAWTRELHTEECLKRVEATRVHVGACCKPKFVAMQHDREAGTPLFAGTLQ